MSKRKWKFETLQVHAGQEPDAAVGARAVPIYQTSAYVFPNAKSGAARFALTEPGYIYTRINNPTVSIFEERINALEGGAGALAFASGQAATTSALLNIAGSGCHIISAKAVYGGTNNLFVHTLGEVGLEFTFVDLMDLNAFKRAVQPNTKAMFVETLDNPNSRIADIEAIAEIAHENGIPLIVDNTFASPYLVRPIEYGADIVIHSATKFIDGHGTSIGGVIIDGGRFDWKANDKFPGLSKPSPSYHGAVFADVAGKAAYITKARTTLLRDMGAALSPFNAFMFLQGLETLSLRMERHIQNTKKIVAFLRDHPKIESISHPSLPECGCKDLYDKYFPNGGASIFTVVIKGGAGAAMEFMDRLLIFSDVGNVADVKSLVTHPASTTNSQMNEQELRALGIEQGTVRMSIGTEHFEDLIYDLEKALI